VYGPYLGRSANWHAWWQQLRQVCPPFDRAERRYLDRVISPIGSHLRRIALAPALTDGDPDLQWQWRNELAGHMRQTLGGDPYHLGLVVAYGALEAIHFERCRALLISQSRGWRAPRVLQGVL
jgi:hypothetical protein